MLSHDEKPDINAGFMPASAQHPQPSVRRLGERLLDRELITPEQLAHALELQSRQSHNLKYLGEILVGLGYLPVGQLGRLLEEVSGIPFVDLSAYPIDPAAAQLVPEELARQHLVLPLDADEERISLAMEDPQDRDTIHELQRHTGRRIVPMLALLTDLLAAIDRSYLSQAPAKRNGPVIEGASLLRLDSDATDIHLEPREDGLWVRFYRGGVEHTLLLRPDAEQAATVTFRFSSPSG